MFFELLILKSLRHIIHNQEIIMSQIDDLDVKITALEADEASVAADLAVLIAELKPLPIPPGHLRSARCASRKAAGR